MHGTFNKSARAVAQEPQPKNYSDETPKQQADHREIEQRYRKQNRKPVLFARLRKCELERFFADRWGDTLPDDDAGRADLRLMADHLAQLGDGYIRQWTDARAPWLSDDQADALIAEVGPGTHWKADALARELRLDDATRTRLKIRTIGAIDRTKAQRAKRSKKQKAMAVADRRAKAGAVPRAMSEARLKPWLALGISESTYRRNKRRDSNSSPILLYSQGTKRCQGSPTVDAAHDPALDTAIAAPMIDPAQDAGRLGPPAWQRLGVVPILARFERSKASMPWVRQLADRVQRAQGARLQHA
jgi:hypothetical protein